MNAKSKIIRAINELNNTPNTARNVRFSRLQGWIYRPFQGEEILLGRNIDEVIYHLEYRKEENLLLP